LHFSVDNQILNLTKQNDAKNDPIFESNISYLQNIKNSILKLKSNKDRKNIIRSIKSEIENKNVLQDLVKQPKLLAANYGIIHAESPDERGIDVAAIYNQSQVKISKYTYHHITLPDTSDRTRDILHVEAFINNEVVHFLINHWPSRRGGQTESEVSRESAARVVRNIVDSLTAINSSAKVLITGDFNDYPVDKSISSVLGASGERNKVLFNFMYKDHVNGKGSYYYNGSWGALDQFIATNSFLETKGVHFNQQSARFFNDELLMFKDDKGVLRPNRTYVGEKYIGGYSDHLSIYIVLHK
jgi:hypothetical protein